MESPTRTNQPDKFVTFLAKSTPATVTHSNNGVASVWGLSEQDQRNPQRPARFGCAQNFILKNHG